MGKLLKDEVQIDEGCRIENAKFGSYCEIGAFNVVQNTEFGDYSYSGSNCIFQNVVIGKFSNIAAYVRIGATDHPMDRASLHHFTYRSSRYGLGEDDADFFEHRVSRVTTIGHDTWIGHGALIKPGISIGNGAVIGQGSVVTKDVEPYAIVAGNPAKLIRYRFSKDISDELNEIAWWNWSHEEIQETYLDFREDIQSFLEKYSTRKVMIREVEQVI